MCTGAILLYNIPRVVIGENVNFQGGDDYLRSRGVEVIVLDDSDCKEIMSKFIKEHPAVRLCGSFILHRREAQYYLGRNGMRISESPSMKAGKTYFRLKINC